MKFSSRFGILLLACTVLLSGCASKYGTQTTQVNHFPQCYEPINRLRQTEKEFTTTVATGVVGGALLGALVGYLSTGKTQGAVAGAVAGGAVGGAVGYNKASNQETRDLAIYLSELEGDISGLDNANAAGRVAMQCYDKSFKSSVADFKAKRINRTDFDSRYKEIRDGSDEALRLMRSQASKAAEKERQYQDALMAEAKAANRPVPTPIKASARKPTKSGSKKTAAKQPAARPSASKDKLTQMAEQTQVLNQSRTALEEDIASGTAMRDSWDQDMTTIRS